MGHAKHDDGPGLVVAIATIDLDKLDLDHWLAEIGDRQLAHDH